MSDLRSDARRHAAERAHAEATGADRVVRDVFAEIARQQKLREAGRFGSTIGDCAAGGDHLTALAILTEEVGEVAQEVLRHDRRNATPGRYGHSVEDAILALRAELVQVAACAVSWIQALDGEAGDGRVRHRDDVQGSGNG